MEDLTQFAISGESKRIAEEIRDKYYFKDLLPIVRLGLTYALKYHRNDIKFEELDHEYDNDGSKYNAVGTFDENNMIASVIKSIYPNCETPYRYARVLINYGLKKIEEKLSSPNSDLFEIIENG